MAVFTDIVFDKTTQNPQADIYSLSASNNSVVLDTLGTLSGVAVAGILFDLNSSAGTANVSLSAFDGTSFRVHESYHGAQCAIYTTDRRSVLFTVNTGVATQTITEAFDYNNGPIERRLRLLEII